MKKPSTATPAVGEAEQREQLTRQASEATSHDAEELRRSGQHSAARLGMPTPRRWVPRLRFKRASSPTAVRLTHTPDVLAERPRLGAPVRVRKRVQRLTPTRQTAFRHCVHALLYAFLHAVLPTRHAREHVLRWPHKGGGTSTSQRPGRPSRPDQRPTVRRPRRRWLPAPAARVHAAPWHSARTRGGRRRQPRGRPAADTPSRGTTASIGDKAALPAVLVVDDEPAHRRLLHEILALEGRTVYLAEHGGPALQQLRASAEGMVVLLGLMMPQVDGEALLEAVAADTALAKRHAFVVVTAATPLATWGRVAVLRRVLGIPLIAKPFTVSEILQAVGDATRRLTSGPLPRD
jgi:CheY-like chemotaxis protein